ncbi:MAG TPA: hypothetical protein VNU71_13400 [Burkholderiaceae bacterium]|nr:hypothetical protein [Burkholderiaceae bacterium]
MNPMRKLDIVSNAPPDPPYPADLRAKGFTFAIDWELVKQGRTWILCPPEMRPWLMMLWAWSWTNSPAGSYENDDELIAASIGMDYRLFMAHRDQLMRGWVLHSDDRLYHEHITTLVLDMGGRREKDRTRVAAWRAARKAETPAPVLPEFTDVARNTGVRPREYDTGTGSGTGTEEEKEKAPRKRGAGSAAPTVGVDQLVNDGVDRQHAIDWLTARKAKRLPLTPTAWVDTKVEASKAKMTIGEAIHTAAINSWGGFRASWLEKPDTKRINFADVARMTVPGESPEVEAARRAAAKAEEDRQRAASRTPEAIAAREAARARLKSGKPT